MMPIAKTIKAQPWMVSEQSAAVMDALAGDTQQALFVGGCVRNTLLRRAVDDIDIATRLKPDEVMSRLAKAGIRAIPTGIDHGTVTAVIAGKSFEITTLRRDVETDGRHAVVAFTQSWEEDAARRDFTMNTLLADPSGHIYDPTGQGLVDLEAGKIAFVGDPAQRIAEDYLRILRFFRFYACYGSGMPDPEALAACYAAADKISTLSRERITQEFLKIIVAPGPAATLALMFTGGVMADLPSENYEPAVLKRLADLQDRHQKPGLVTRLAVLTETPDKAGKYLVLSGQQRKSWALIRQAANGNLGIKQRIYRYGHHITMQALLLKAAQEQSVPDLTLAENWQPPAFPLTGEDILSAGIKAGPEVGRILGAVEDWWLDHDLVPDRAACLAYLKTLL